MRWSGFPAAMGLGSAIIATAKHIRTAATSTGNRAFFETIDIQAGFTRAGYRTELFQIITKNIRTDILNLII